MTMELRELPPPAMMDAESRARRIGIIALSTDLVIDPFLARLCHGLPVEVFINRIRFRNPMTVANLAAMKEDLDRAVQDLLSERPLEAIAFACTSGSVAIGEEVLATRIARLKPEARITNPVTAALAAMAALGAQRVSVLTPYTREVTAALGEDFQARGLEVLSAAAFGVEDDRDVPRITPEAIRDGARRALRPGSQALFISCTALRAAEEVEQLEKELGIPVVTSNQALAWHALRLAGVEERVEGYGRLLALALRT